jgi:hypothetical protein
MDDMEATQTADLLEIPTSDIDRLVAAIGL